MKSSIFEQLDCKISHPFLFPAVEAETVVLNKHMKLHRGVECERREESIAETSALRYIS